MEPSGRPAAQPARCGFVAARSDWIEGFTDLKVATSFGGGRLTAELVLAVLSDGGYRKHFEVLRGRLAAARREVGSKLQALGIAPGSSRGRECSCGAAYQTISMQPTSPEPPSRPDMAGAPAE